jgi:hypothetical protein
MGRRSSASHKYGSLVFMRTTVDIPDTTYRLLKSKAAAEGTSVKAIVLHAVEIVLAEHEPKRKKRTLPVIESKGTRVIDLTNEQIYDLIEFP